MDEELPHSYHAYVVPCACVQMMKMSGMHTSSYWLGTYMFDIAYFVIIATIYVVAGYAFSIPTVINASPFLFIATLGCWAHAQVGTAFFLGAIFPNSRFASIISYMLIVVVSCLLAHVASGRALCECVS